jgi:hypothetical protein
MPMLMLMRGMGMMGVICTDKQDKTICEKEKSQYSKNKSRNKMEGERVRSRINAYINAGIICDIRMRCR